jgi:hypothetical protein
MTPPGKEILENIAAEYFLRDLTDQELTWLQRGLQEDEALRERFVQAARDEFLLTQFYQEPEEVKLLAFPRRRRLKRGVRRIAASIAILLSLATIFLSRYMEVSNKISDIPNAPVVAHVTGCFVLEADAISVVNEGKLRTIEANSELRAGDRVVVPFGSRLTFQYNNEDTFVEMSGGTFFSLQEEDGAKFVRLRQGTMWADVAKQPNGKPLRIMTDDAEAVVLGTSFEISANQFTRLSVVSGMVRFKSHDNDHSVEVSAGHLADSQRESLWKSLPFAIQKLYPVLDQTINRLDCEKFIAVDPKRNLCGFLSFDLSNVRGKVIEARLRLRVANNEKEACRSGDIRLYSLPAEASPATAANYQRRMISRYEGRIGGGMDLEFLIEPANLSSNLNAFMIGMLPGGDSFLFNASESPEPPQLILKVETKSTKPLGQTFTNGEI